MNGARWTLVLAGALWVTVRVARNVTGAPRPRGHKALRAASGPAAPVLVKVGPQRARHPVLLWTTKRVILAAHVWPRTTAGTAGGVAVALWGWLLVQGVAWWAGLVLALPGLVLAGYALARARRTRHLDPWATLWSRLSQDVVQDGKVITKAVLPGSKVQGRVVYDRDTDGTLRRVGLNVRGYGPHQTLQEVRAKAGAIAAAYLVPASAVNVVQGDHNAEAIVWVTMREWLARQEATRATRLRTTYPLDGPALDRERGTVRVGVVMDDGSPALWRLYTPGVGAHHGALYGSTRTGKSNAVHALLLAATGDRVVSPCVIDLEGGVSLGWWAARAAAFADSLDDATVLLTALDREYEARTTYMRAHGIKVLDPSTEWPLIPCVIDGVPELAQKAGTRAQQLLSRAARLWAKTGMCIIVCSQTGTAELAFGKDAGTAARAQLQATNVWGFRADAQTSRIAVGSGDLDLEQIPRGIPGASLLWTPEHPDAALIRAHLAPDDAPWVDVAPFDWPAEPILSTPGHRPQPPLSVVRDIPGPGQAGYLPDPDPEARIRAVLRDRGPLTTAELIDATRIGKTRMYDLLPRMRGVAKDIKHGGRWSLVKEES